MTTMRELLGQALPAMALQYRVDLTPGTLELYLLALEGEDVPRTRAALMALLRDPDRKWMPTTNEVVAALHGTTSDASRLAWGIVTEAAKVYRALPGAWADRAPVHEALKPLSDQGWDALERVGGLGHVAHAIEEHEPSARKNYLEAFEALARAAKREELPKLGGGQGRIER